MGLVSKHLIKVMDYQSEWKDQFESLKARIWPKVSKHSIKIEHIGSTSIEGLVAKPVVDLDIVVKNRSNLLAVIKVLSGIGYSHRGNLGVDGREAFAYEAPDIPHNLYMCLDQCTAFKNHIFLRNHLRKNSKDREHYSQLKQLLAWKYPNDIESYIDGKTEFILRILKKHDLSSDELSKIEDVNKKKS